MYITVYWFKQRSKINQAPFPHPRILPWAAGDLESFQYWFAYLTWYGVSMVSLIGLLNTRKMQIMRCDLCSHFSIEHRDFNCAPSLLYSVLITSNYSYVLKIFETDHTSYICDTFYFSNHLFCKTKQKYSQDKSCLHVPTSVSCCFYSIELSVMIIGADGYALHLLHFSWESTWRKFVIIIFATTTITNIHWSETPWSYICTDRVYSH